MLTLGAALMWTIGQVSLTGNSSCDNISCMSMFSSERTLLANTRTACAMPLRSPPTIRSQLAEVFKTVVVADFPEKWPGLLQPLYNNLVGQVGCRLTFEGDGDGTHVRDPGCIHFENMTLGEQQITVEMVVRCSVDAAGRCLMKWNKIMVRPFFAPSHSDSTCSNASHI